MPRTRLLAATCLVALTAAPVTAQDEWYGIFVGDGIFPENCAVTGGAMLLNNFVEEMDWTSGTTSVAGRTRAVQDSVLNGLAEFARERGFHAIVNTRYEIALTETHFDPSTGLLLSGEPLIGRGSGFVLAYGDAVTVECS